MSDPVTWKFHTTTETAWKAMQESIRGAQKTIDFEQYLIGGDNGIEREFCELLAVKSREGVKVRLFLDGVGSFYFYYSSLPAILREAGVQVLYHKMVLPRVIRRFIPVILRDHRKLLVLDGEVAHIGGVVVQEKSRQWRDTNVELRGSIVFDLQNMFDRAWDRSKKWKPLRPIASEDSVKDDFVAVGNSYHLRDKHLYRTILRTITTAKKSVQITTPYFAPGREFLRALYYVAKKGVKVEILLPRRSDNIFADFVAKLHHKSLLKNGVRLYLYDAGVLHQKTITIDDDWASVGSSNFDWISFWLNYELNIVTTNPQFVADLKSHFVEDLKKSEEVTIKTRRWFFK